MGTNPMFEDDMDIDLYANLTRQQGSATYANTDSNNEAYDVSTDVVLTRRTDSALSPLASIPDDEVLVTDEGDEYAMGDLRGEARQIASMERTLSEHLGRSVADEQESAEQQLKEVRQQKVKNDNTEVI